MKPDWTGDGVELYLGDCIESMDKLPAQSVHTCVTSPPYYALRDYGVDGQIGLEDTPEAFVAKMVEVFRAVGRVLRDDGTLWLNLGDTYNSPTPGARNATRWPKQSRNDHAAEKPLVANLKAKDLMGMPWRVALALQADGWYLRQDIIWHKPNPMPESVTDRCTKSHEYIFLLTKSPRYFYDNEAIREPAKYGRREWSNAEDVLASATTAGDKRENHGVRTKSSVTGSNPSAGRNKRSVWTVPTYAMKEAHFATFPPKLIEPCILAGTSEEGCCPNCGAGWVRVTEKTRVRTRPGLDSKTYDRTTGEVTDDGIEKPWRDKAEIGNRDPGRHVTKTVTTGFEPSCDCDAGDPVPCVVLDPFGGAVTTGVVAAQHRRKAILCELNPEYSEIARKRIERELREQRIQPKLFR